MRENFVQQHFEEAVSIAPTPMLNLLQDIAQKKVDYTEDIAVPAMPCDILKVSTDHASTISENNREGNKKDATLAQGENSFDKLTFSTNHAIIEQHLVEPLIDLPLLQDDLPMLLEDFPADSCDKELCVDSSISHVPQLVDNCDTFSLEPYILEENKSFLPITSAQDELKLLSSLNTLGYIGFDVLCNLSCLEERIFANSDLSWLSHNTYHFIGKYNFRGEYMVHQVYICSNLKYSLVVHQCDQVAGYNTTNPVMLSFSSFILKKQVQFKER
jgi:hypothetical protein